MTSNVQDPSVPATNALCKTAVVDTLEAALKHDGTESGEFEACRHAATTFKVER